MLPSGLSSTQCWKRGSQRFCSRGRFSASRPPTHNYKEQSNDLRNSSQGLDRDLALTVALTLSPGIAVAQPSTTTTTMKQGVTTTTSQLEGTVLAVDGTNLLVKMSTGEIRHIVASESQRALMLVEKFR